MSHPLQIAAAHIALNEAVTDAAEKAAAEVVFLVISEDGKKGLGELDPIFGEEVTKVRLVRQAVADAQREGVPYKYGAFALDLFGARGLPGRES